MGDFWWRNWLWRTCRRDDWCWLWHRNWLWRTCRRDDWCWLWHGNWLWRTCVETFGSTLAPSFATAPLVGSISAGLPMTTMAAPTMTTMGAPVGAFGSPLVGTSYGLPPTVL